MTSEGGVTMASAPVYVTIPQSANPQTKTERIEKLFPKKTILAFSIIQLICAGSAALLQVCKLLECN